MSSYVSAAELKNYIGGIAQSNPAIDTIIDQVILTASRAVDAYCGRYFTADVDGAGSAVATARTYQVSGYCERLRIDDIADRAGATVKVDPEGDGTYGTTWVAGTNFLWGPSNQLSNGIVNWPTTDLVPVDLNAWPVYRNQRDQVQITAQWGWPSVPDAIKSCTFMTALDLLKMKDAPFGVANFDQYGPVRARANAQVAQLLDGTYCRRLPGFA